MGAAQDFGVLLGIMFFVPFIFLFMCFGVGSGSGLQFIADWCTDKGTTVNALYQFVSITWVVTIAFVFVAIKFIKKWGE